MRYNTNWIIVKHKLNDLERGTLMILHQKTLKKEIQYKGAGLHSGAPVTMVFKPAPENTGIVFVRTDLEGHPSVKADIDNVTNTMRQTTLECGDAKVFTVEHVMAAMNAMNVDNCYIEMDSPEPPVADGASHVFVGLIKQVGLVEQEAERYIHRVQKVHSIYDGDRFITLLPYDGLRITFTSINSHPMLGTQYADFEITPESFEREISPARTIGFLKELEQLREMGLAKGGNLENALVYDDTKCLSVPKFDNELVRHKMLDILGDLYLVGPIKGHIIAVKSSHELNSKLSHSLVKEIRA